MVHKRRITQYTRQIDHDLPHLLRRSHRAAVVWDIRIDRTYVLQIIMWKRVHRSRRSYSVLAKPGTRAITRRPPPVDHYLNTAAVCTAEARTRYESFRPCKNISVETLYTDYADPWKWSAWSVQQWSHLSHVWTLTTSYIWDFQPRTSQTGVEACILAQDLIRS